MNASDMTGLYHSKRTGIRLIIKNNPRIREILEEYTGEPYSLSNGDLAHEYMREIERLHRAAEDELRSRMVVTQQRKDLL